MLLRFYIFSQTIRGPFLWCEPTWFACLFWWLITKTKAWSKSAQSQSPRVLSQSASDKPSVRPLSSYLSCTLAQRMHSPSPLKSTCWGLVTLKFDQAWPRMPQPDKTGPRSDGMPSDTAAGVTRERPLNATVSLFGDFGNFDVWEAQTQTPQANSGEIEECKYDPGR